MCERDGHSTSCCRGGLSFPYKGPVMAVRRVAGRVLQITHAKPQIQRGPATRIVAVSNTRPAGDFRHRLFTTTHQPQHRATMAQQQEKKEGITMWVGLNDKSGEFKRQVSSFRDAISREPGAKYPPEKGRYHLFVSYACPWVRTCAPRFLTPRVLRVISRMLTAP